MTNSITASSAVPDFDVAIVGAGPVGLALANWLLRDTDWRIALFDARDAEAAARNVVRRCDQRRRDHRIARQVVRARWHAVQRDAVLVGREAEHGEAVRVAVDARHQQHTRQRRGHRGNVAALLGRHAGRRHEAFRAAHFRRGRIAAHLLLLLRHDHDRVDDQRLEARIGNEHVLIGEPLHLFAIVLAESGLSAELADFDTASIRRLHRPTPPVKMAVTCSTRHGFPAAPAMTAFSRASGDTFEPRA